MKDCDLALEVCKDSPKALYRKAMCLKESGKLSEAYDCTAAFMLTSPQVNIDNMTEAHHERDDEMTEDCWCFQDKTVSSLAQELAVSLGLKSRKPYSPQVSTHNSLHDAFQLFLL